VTRMPGARTCAFCGDRDPMRSGRPSVNWTVVNGLDRCADCGWMGYTDDLRPIAGSQEPT
jgi:hypothetical protein